MPKFKVRIVEQIKETREYEIEAETAREAAEQASIAWITNGIEPEEGKCLDVEERDYVVTDEEHNAVEFDGLEIEFPLKEDFPDGEQ